MMENAGGVSISGVGDVRRDAAGAGVERGGVCPLHEISANRVNKIATRFISDIIIKAW